MIWAGYVDQVVWVFIFKHNIITGGIISAEPPSPQSSIIHFRFENWRNQFPADVVNLSWRIRNFPQMQDGSWYWVARGSSFIIHKIRSLVICAVMCRP